MSAAHSIVSEPEFERTSTLLAAIPSFFREYWAFDYGVESRLDRKDRSLTRCSPALSPSISLLALAFRSVQLVIDFSEAVEEIESTLAPLFAQRPELERAFKGTFRLSCQVITRY